MDLRDTLKTEEVEQELLYIRAGKTAKAYPKKDCTINSDDVTSQLTKVSGAFYFYGQILGEIETAIREAKITLKKITGLCYQNNQMELQKSNTRITEKLLESLINTDLTVINAGEKLASLEGSKTKIDTILTALRLKDGDLNELSRRQYLEAKAVNRLT